MNSINFKRFGAENIMVFARTYFPHYLKINPCGFHRELCGFLESISQERGGRLAIAAPRGSAKSSYVSMIYVLWCICYSKEQYIIMLSDTTQQAEGLLSHVKKELEENEILARDFPEVCVIDDAKMPNWKKGEITTKNNIKITALGAGQKIRGRRNQEHRPTLIILDDIENDQNTQSSESREKLYDWFTKAVMKVGSKDTNVIFVGTIQQDDCLLAKFTNNETPGWQKKIYKAVISFAKREDLWAQWVTIYNSQIAYGNDSGPKAALEFFKDNEAALLEEVQVLWPEKESYYDLMVMREVEGEVSFNSEKQNTPYNLKDAIFKPDSICYWDEGYNSEEEFMEKHGDKLTYYLACDPSLGKPGKRGDYSAVILVARHKDTGKFYVIAAAISKMTPEDLTHTVVGIARMLPYKLKKVFIESNQFQELLVQNIEECAYKVGVSIPIKRVHHSSDKIARIQSLEPWINAGRVLFSHDQRLLIDQLVHFPKGKNDDGPDALEMAISNALTDGEHEIGFVSLT